MRGCFVHQKQISYHVYVVVFETCVLKNKQSRAFLRLINYANQLQKCVVQDTFFLGVFSMIKSCGFFIVGIFSVFSRQNFVPYFYDHFHFLLGAKNSRVFLFHLIQLLIIMLILIKKFDGSYIFFEYRYIPSKTHQIFFCFKLIKVRTF